MCPNHSAGAVSSQITPILLIVCCFTLAGFIAGGLVFFFTCVCGFCSPPFLSGQTSRSGLPHPALPCVCSCYLRLAQNNREREMRKGQRNFSSGLFQLASLELHTQKHIQLLRNLLSRSLRGAGKASEGVCGVFLGVFLRP